MPRPAGPVPQGQAAQLDAEPARRFLLTFRPGLAETLPQSAYLQQEETPARQKTTWTLLISGLRPARFEKHFGVLFCWSIEKLGRAPLQMPVEERQRVGINDVVRPTFIDWP